MEYETTHEEVALYVGRFQPLTFGQLNAIEQIQRENISKLIIGIGSCEEEYSLKNPLSFEERKTLFERVLSKKNLEYEIFGIPDLGDNKAWAQYILRELPHFDSLYSGNARTLACFENTNIKRKNLTIEVPIKASIVRQRIKQGLDISEYVPEEVQSYIKEIDLQARLKLLSSQELQTPYLAVDGIVEVKNEEGKEGVLLIERKNKPLGWAFPGGFVDIGETVEDALLREIFEETSLQGSKESLLGIYSDPNRDPRQHVVSAVYTLQGSGTWKEGSDAKGIRFVPLENLLREELVFDHKIIAQDYMKQRGERR